MYEIADWFVESLTLLPQPIVKYVARETLRLMK